MRGSLRQSPLTRTAPSFKSVAIQDTSDDPTHHRPVPRRSCRQFAAARIRARCAGEARARRDQRSTTARDRGPRHRRRDPEAGGGRPAACDRRRTAPLVVAVRLLPRPRWRGDGSDRQGHQIPRGRHQDGERAHVGQARLLRPSAHRGCQIPQGALQGHAENDHSRAGRAALPAGPGVGEQGSLSEPRQFLRGSGADLQEGGARVL